MIETLTIHTDAFASGGNESLFGPLIDSCYDMTDGNFIFNSENETL